MLLLPIRRGGVSTTVTVSYNSTTETYSYNSSTITFKVPSNISYTISFADISEYKTPDPITRTSTLNNSISFTVIYNEKPLSVGIVDTNGNIVRISDWTGGSNATGVYVNDGDGHEIIVAPDEWYGEDSSWNTYTTSNWHSETELIQDCFTTTTLSEALSDFNGSTNTTAILSSVGITTYDATGHSYSAPAAQYCNAYSNGYKGVGEWYLPSMGEINIIVQNRSEIDEALIKISGVEFESSDHTRVGWSSTQCDSTNAWCYCWVRNAASGYPKSYNGLVRPICQY